MQKVLLLGHVSLQSLPRFRQARATRPAAHSRGTVDRRAALPYPRDVELPELDAGAVEQALHEDLVHGLQVACIRIGEGTRSVVSESSTHVHGI